MGDDAGGPDHDDGRHAEPPVAVIVFDRLLTIVASNALADTLLPAFRVGANLARFTFLEGDVHPDMADWQRKAAQVVGMLRASIAMEGSDEQVIALVGELGSLSNDFVRSWALQPAPLYSDVFEFRHPRVGELRLRYRLEHVEGATGHMMAVWSAADAASLDGLHQLDDPSR